MPTSKAKNCKIDPGPGADKRFVYFLRQRAVFGNLWGGTPRASPAEAQKYENQGPKSQNEKKSKTQKPKWKEIKAQKAKMKGHEGLKSQNEIKAQKAKVKEMKAQTAKIT